MSINSDCKYTKDHEWTKDTGTNLRVGVSDYAQSELGDIVYVELPEVGKEIKKGDVVMTVESVKAVSEIYAPVSGKVSAVNEDLSQQPELVNESPFESGWMFELSDIEQSEASELMSAGDYENFLSTL